MQEIESDVSTLRQEWTPKQKENWENHGKPVYDELPSNAQTWYVRLYRPKKRGDGMMERDHVRFGTPEHYLKKKIDGIRNPMGSIQGEVMASFGVDNTDELDEVAVEILKVTLTDTQKQRMKSQGRRLAGILGK